MDLRKTLVQRQFVAIAIKGTYQIHCAIIDPSGDNDLISQKDTDGPLSFSRKLFYHFPFILVPFMSLDAETPLDHVVVKRPYIGTRLFRAVNDRGNQSPLGVSLTSRKRSRISITACKKTASQIFPKKSSFFTDLRIHWNEFLTNSTKSDWLRQDSTWSNLVGLGRNIVSLWSIDDPRSRWLLWHQCIVSLKRLPDHSSCPTKRINSLRSNQGNRQFRRVFKQIRAITNDRHNKCWTENQQQQAQASASNKIIINFNDNHSEYSL